MESPASALNYVAPDIDNTFSCRHDETQTIEGLDADSLEYTFQLTYQGKTTNLLIDESTY